MKTRYRIQAFVYNKRGEFMGVGYNSYTKSHPLQAYFAKQAGIPNKIYLHAEMEALIRAGLGTWKTTYPYSIDVTSKDNNGKLRNAKPCLICTLAMIAFGIKKVNYTTPEGWVYGKTPEEILEEHKQQSTKDK